MKEGVDKLISKMVFLDNDYFKMALTQLETFLSMIGNELHSGFGTTSISDISKICSFEYLIKDILFKNYADDKNKWSDTEGGLFGYDRTGTAYTTCLKNFNNHLEDEFKNDWRKFNPTVTDHGQDSIQNRDYFNILLDGIPDYTTAESIQSFRKSTIADIHGILDCPPTSPDDIIDIIFKKEQIDPETGNILYDETWSNKVRYINTIRTTLKGNLVGAFVADDTCNMFVDIGGDGEPKIMWYTFDSTHSTMDMFVERKVESDNKEFEFEPRMKFTQHPITNEDWLFKMLNRDFTLVGRSKVNDTFAIHCKNKENGQELWYVPQLDSYIYGASSTQGVLDLAYEQYGDRLYVMFCPETKEDGTVVYDNHLYAYDNVASTKTFDGFVILKKETANLKLATFNSMCITDDALCFDRMFLDYFQSDDGKDTNQWNLALYGENKSKTPVEYNEERWYFRPGADRNDFQMYNSIMFGDSLFDLGQLRFHNISKNKDMYDILDVNEIDGRYYGLFKNENKGSEIHGQPTYTVFKAEKDGGVVQRLPWQILDRHMYRTNDSLYALYVVSNEPVGDEELHPVLREITVPDSDEYPERVLDIYNLYKDKNGEDERAYIENPVSVIDLLMDEFRLKSKDGKFFALTNKGFHRIDYIDDFDQLSIDKMDGRNSDNNLPVGFRDKLLDTFKDTVLEKHMVEMHDEEQRQYFEVLKSKMNQFASDFTVFDLIPTEFLETQDVGVIPNGPVDDLDDVEDHRGDSILTSTDILWTDGMVAQIDTNPGIVTAAVSNPATIYDDDTVFTKSQRNPSIEGTEFYDFIYDQDGNTLMDLYAIPFIYRINSNNTYDLYINIPTTRTKYLNRIAGTLMDNGTNQVLPDDTRTRLNFLGEAMPNNLDESTTRLQVFMDKRYLSIGTVELVEISGNSIPTQIYRDVPNNGLYDSLALESRWNGEVV